MLLAGTRTVPDHARIEALATGAIDWRAFLDLAASHGVRPLVYKSLRETCWNRVPADVQHAWEEAHQLITGRNLFLTGELLRVTAEFHKAGIPVAAVKGPVIAQMAYGDSSTLREFSDLDLLVHEADFPRAVELIAQLGYKPFWELDNRSVLRFLRHLGEYKLTSDFLGADIDLHWKPAHHSVALSPAISDFPAGFQPIPIAGSTVPTFAPRDLPLYLASQGGGDQWGDLRRICDLAEFLRAYAEIDWEPQFKTANRLGGLRSMLTGLALARDLLGATLPASAASRIHADPVVARLADRTMRNLRQQRDPGEPVSRYWFQLGAKQGVCGKLLLAFSILIERTSEDGSWIMLPRPLWWLYAVLRPLRMSRKFLRRA
ncbi:MAG: nucleotidyltransferase family protein [Acidobacteriaceae bacterium]